MKKKSKTLIIQRKKIIQFILEKVFLIIIFISISPLMAIEFYRPRFLVDKEPVPPAFYMKGYIPLNENAFSPDMNSTEKLNANQHRFELDSYLIPIISQEDLLLIFGPGYGYEFYRIGIESWDINYYGLWANLFATGSIGANFYWMTYQSLGLFSTDIAKADSRARKYFQFTSLGYKWNNRLSTHLGVIYTSNFGDNVFLPLLGVGYRVGPVLLEAILPIKLGLRFLISEYVHLVFSGRYLYSAYLNQENSQNSPGMKEIDEFSKTEIALNTEWKIMDWTWVSFGLSYWTKTDIYRRTEKEKVKAAQLDNEFQFNVSLIIR